MKIPKEIAEQIALAKRGEKLGKQLWEDMRLHPDLERLGVSFLKRKQRHVLRETSGLKAFWVSPGGVLDMCTVKEEMVEPPVDFVGFHLYESTDKLMQQRTWGSFRKLGVEQLVDAIGQRADVCAKALNLRPEQVRLSVAVKAPQVKTYIEDDNWYFHVMCRAPVSTVAMPK